MSFVFCQIYLYFFIFVSKYKGTCIASSHVAETCNGVFEHLSGTVTRLSVWECNRHNNRATRQITGSKQQANFCTNTCSVKHHRASSQWCPFSNETIPGHVPGSQLVFPLLGQCTRVFSGPDDASCHERSEQRAAEGETDPQTRKMTEEVIKRVTPKTLKPVKRKTILQRHQFSRCNGWFSCWRTSGPERCSTGATADDGGESSELQTERETLFRQRNNSSSLFGRVFKMQLFFPRTLDQMYLNTCKMTGTH